MTRGAFGRWAVRFLAAAGVSSVACSGHYVGTNQGSAGSSGSGHAGSKAEGNAGTTAPSDGGEPTSSGGGTRNTNAAGEPGATAGTTNEAGAGALVEPDPENAFPCLEPRPYANPGSGLELCKNGMIHRKTVGQCAEPLPNTTAGCVTDADCPPGPNDVGTVCRCDVNGLGACTTANCDYDGACADGFACVLADFCAAAGGHLGFACQTPEDTCAPGNGLGGVGCVPGVNDAFETLPMCNGTGGRPFLIDAMPRTTSTQLGRDWHEPSLELATLPVTSELRASLAAHWQRQAEMEHASVAAFARFVLELLSLGAPPDLVGAATSALADETAHARLCYSLASSYAQVPLSAAPLDVTGALADLSPDGIVMRAVLEGCVGETLAAIEATDAAAHATEPTLQRVLARIAEDEARHAELSWRFLRWMLTRQEPALRETVREAFARARRELVARTVAVTNDDATGLLEHGVLDPSRAAILALSAFDSVIAPCADALLTDVGRRAERAPHSFEVAAAAGAALTSSWPAICGPV